MKLDEEFLKKIRFPIDQTWQAIGSDVIQCCDESGSPCTNGDAIESCIDADRLASFASKEANELIKSVIEEHGYTKVFKFLTKNIRLN